MGRFLRYLILNAAGLGLIGWMQFSLVDADGLQTRLAALGWRGSGYSAHK